MTVEEMRVFKKQRGYTYEQIAELSGVPLGTVQKIFSGETQSPRYATLQALERVFGDMKQEASGVREASACGIGKKQGEYTIEDYYALPEEHRAELIDGVIYDMSAPTTGHQGAAGEIYRQIANFIAERRGGCNVFVSPVDVQLDCDDRTMVQPDVMILCDKNKIKRWGILGAPDFVLEILSASTKRKDCIKKLDKYMEAGVREYWIIDPDKETLLVYQFEQELYPAIYGLNGSVPVGIYDGRLQINLDMVRELLEEYRGDTAL